jgi:hypothetical protein
VSSTDVCFVEEDALTDDDPFTNVAFVEEEDSLMLDYLDLVDLCSMAPPIFSSILSTQKNVDLSLRLNALTGEEYLLKSSTSALIEARLSRAVATIAKILQIPSGRVAVYKKTIQDGPSLSS